jgi:TatA/E family protein of Tat protein translocase
MLNLDPAKLLVIAVVAIILLGPDKLPQVARQVGGAWRSFNEFRHRMETEVRSSMPDLPSTTEIARLARSPSALLDHLSNMGSDDDAASPEGDGEQAPELGEGTGGDHGETTELGVADEGDATPSSNGSVTNGSVPDGVETAPLADSSVQPSTPTPAPTSSLFPSPAATTPDVTPEQRSPDVIIPADPSLN